MIKMLIISQDEIESNRKITRALTQLGYTVFITSDQSDLMEKLRSFRFTLAIIDQYTTADSVNAVIHTVRKQLPTLPLLVVGKQPFQEDSDANVTCCSNSLSELLYAIERTLAQHDANAPAESDAGILDDIGRVELRKNKHAALTKKRLANYFSTLTRNVQLTRNLQMGE